MYAADEVVTGQPIFRRVTGPIALRYAYTLTPEKGVAEKGATLLNVSARIVLRIANGSDWEREVPLIGPSRSRSGKVTLATTLPVTKLERLAAQAGSDAGFGAGDVSIRLVPQVEVKAVIAGKPLTTTFGTPSTFIVTKEVIRIVTSQVATPVGVPVGAQTSGTLAGPVRYRTAHANVMGLKVAISSMRYAGVGFLFVAGGLAILVLIAAAATRTG